MFSVEHLDNRPDMRVLNQIGPLKKRTKQPFRRPTSGELATITTRECGLKSGDCLWWSDELLALHDRLPL